MQEISPTELKARLDAGERPLLIDVREDWEVELVALDGARHVPPGGIPGELAGLDHGADVVVYCHHGFRSRQAAMLLEREGFARVHNLTGGIDAWVREVDPALPVY